MGPPWASAHVVFSVERSLLFILPRLRLTHRSTVAPGVVGIQSPASSLSSVGRLPVAGTRYPPGGKLRGLVCWGSQPERTQSTHRGRKVGGGSAVARVCC